MPTSTTKWTMIGAAVLLVLWIVGRMAPTPPASTSVTTPAKSPDAELRAGVESALGRSNRNIERVFDVTLRSGRVEVHWRINDNLTTGMVHRGAQIDVVNILKAVRASGLPHEQIAVFGSFPLSDKFGHSSEEQVVRATYMKSTLERINYDAFQTDNTFAVADSAYVHPAFKQ